MPIILGRGPDSDRTLVADYENGLSVTYEWGTEIIPAEDGREQRISQVATARERYSFQAILDDAQLRLIQTALAVPAAQALPFHLVLQHEAMPVLGAAAETITLADTSMMDWAYGGSRVALVDSEGGFRAPLVIQTVSSTELVLDDDVEADVEDGLDMIAQVMPVQLESVQQVGLHENGAAIWSISARALIWGDVNGAWNPRGAPAIATYDSLPVLDRPNVGGGPVGRAFATGVQLFDYRGALKAYGPLRSAQIARQLRLVLPTDSERQWFKSFMGTVKGRLKPFLAPTWKPDLEPVGDASSGTLTFYGSSAAHPTRGTDYAGVWSQTGAHTRLQLRLADGSIVYRRITAYGDNGDGTQDVVLDSPVAGELELVSFLELARFDRDEIPIVYAGTAGRVDTQMMVVEQ